MDLLNYKKLRDINYQGYLLENGVEKILQFGEGNFLRAFSDHYIDLMNERANFNAKVVVIKPTSSISETYKKLNSQDCLYTDYIRGRENGVKINNKRIISSLSRCINPYVEFDKYLESASNDDLRFIISNTTEAGIKFDDTCKFIDKPANSFPGKLCQLLYKRWELNKKGFIILSCELIDHNGDELKKCVIEYINLWKLSDEFKKWVEKENIFCSTLVDKIVTGFPKNEIEKLNNENGYIDNCINTAESFGLWVIEGPESIYKELPIKESGLQNEILITDNHMPYKERKVRILNGAHTSTILGAYLAGFDIVRDIMNDNVISKYMDKFLKEEVIPTLSLNNDELLDFANKVTDRFNNPFIDHLLLSISLNSTAKWKARVMPTLLEYVKRKEVLPKLTVMSFAFYISFYHKGNEKVNGTLFGSRKGEKFEIKDDEYVLDFYLNHKNDDNKTLAKNIIENEKMWGNELKNIKGFFEEVVADLDIIDKVGAYEAMKMCV